jgi:hypothetical protein
VKARIGCLVRSLFNSVQAWRDSPPDDGSHDHSLDCPPDCSCWQELPNADDRVGRAVDDFRFTLVFHEQLQATAKEISTATEDGIGVLRIYVGRGLFDADMPPAIIQMDAEARADIHSCEPMAWKALLEICECHRIALKNLIAEE